MNNIVKITALFLSCALFSCGNITSITDEESSTTSSEINETTSSHATTANDAHWNNDVSALMIEVLGVELPYVKLSDDFYYTSYEDGNDNTNNIWISDDSIGNIVSDYGDILLNNNYSLVYDGFYVLMLNGTNINVQVTYNNFSGDGDAFNIIAWAEKVAQHKDSFPKVELESYLDGYDNIVPEYTADLYYFELIDNEVGSKPYFRIYSIFDEITNQEDEYKKILTNNGWSIDGSDYENVGYMAIDKNETLTVWFYADANTKIFALSIMKMDVKVPDGEIISLTKSNFNSSYDTTPTEFTVSDYSFMRQNVNNAGGIAFVSHSKGISFIYNSTSFEKGIKAIVFYGVEQPQKGSEQFKDEITVYASDVSGEKTTAINYTGNETQIFMLNGSKYFYIENLKGTAFNCTSIDIIYNS